MYHSVTFGSKNSYADWHLVPDGRPVVVMPELKTVTVDVPGSYGILDLSESLTGYPIYSNRSGSIKFHVLNDIAPWQKTYEEIARYLHGKIRTMILEDDPNYYYNGRFTVTWTSNNDGSGSDVEIGYDLEPYKYYVQTSVEEDPDTYSNIQVSGQQKIIYFGRESLVNENPIIPEFVVSNVSGSGLNLNLINAELGINKTFNITSNGNRKYYNLILSNISGSNTCNLTISGYGKVNVVFRRLAL
jgi:phage-related protein